MALDTYDGLKASIASWLGLSDDPALVATIPDFITLFESSAERVLRVLQMQTRATTVIDEEYEEIPTNWVEAISLTADGKPLTYVTPETLNEMAATAYAAPACYYTVTGGLFRFYPVPSGSPVLEMAYYAGIPRLSAGTASNWLLRAAPEAYLYGSLAASSTWLREDERLVQWATLATGALNALSEADRKARQSGGPLVMRPSSPMGW